METKDSAVLLGTDIDAVGNDVISSIYSASGIATDGINLYVTDSDNCTIRKIILSTGVPTTFAGKTGDNSFADGTCSAARFNCPRGITTDGKSLYVTDSESNAIRKIVLSTQEVTTLVDGSTSIFNGPRGITTDGTNLYVADSGNGTICKIIISTGEVTTIAGKSGERESKDGIGSAARFSSPSSIATDGTNLYVTEGHVVRKVVLSTGTVTTFVGNATEPGSVDGIGTAARLNYPSGITTDGTNLYVVDSGNSTIRKIVISTGMVTTLAGKARENGCADGIGSEARFDNPESITTDGTALYIGRNDTIRKIAISTGAVTTLSSIRQQLSVDGIGRAARFFHPTGMTADGKNLYVVDTGNSIIRKIELSTGAVTTLAGKAGELGSTDGVGSAASFVNPSGVTMDGKSLYVTDTGNSTVRKIDISTGTVTTLVGEVEEPGVVDGIGRTARFVSPEGITTEGSNLYVADSSGQNIRKIIISTGEVTSVAGEAGEKGTNDGVGMAARFINPQGLVTDGKNLYVTDIWTIRKIVLATMAVTKLAGTPGEEGHIDGLGGAAKFSYPSGIVTDGTNLYVADRGSFAVRKVVLSTGAVTTLAGGGGEGGFMDGVGTAARFNYPDGIARVGENLYVSDTINNTIRKIDISTGTVTTLAGKAGRQM